MLWDLFRIFAADLQNRTMIGTIVNATTIIVGSIIGSLLHRGVKEKYKEVLYTGLGLASLAIGLNATISHFPQSQYPVLFIISLAVGGVIGTALDIDGRFKRLVDKLQRGKKNNGNRLAEGLSTAILLYCIGPLSMLGPVISALKGATPSSLPMPRSTSCRRWCSSLLTASVWFWRHPCCSAGRACSGSLPISAVPPSATRLWLSC